MKQITTHKALARISLPLLPAICLMAMMFLFSCRKQPAGAPPAEVGSELSVKNNRLVFSSTASYRGIVDNTPQEYMEAFMVRVKGMTNFTSYHEYLSSKGTAETHGIAGIGNEFLETILNKDAAVQIGNYIYKIDPGNERVYALKAEHEKEYADLVSGNTANPNVYEFSTSDDVLDLIESGEKKGDQALLCSESGIGGRHISYPIAGGTKNAYADFDRYGIYFSLHATIYPQGSWPSPYVFEFTNGIGAGYIYYHVRCDNTVSYAVSSGGSWTGTTQKYQSYQGSKNLNKVYFYYRVQNSSSGQYETPYFGFRVNI